MRVLAVAVLVIGAVVVAEDAPVVVTQEGRISGVVQESTKGKTFYSYYGIPFATPPLGQLRLKDPIPVEPWEGVRDGSLMPEMCLQVPFGMTAIGIRLPAGELYGSEDCLYLNVFTPTPGDEGSRLPVIVFIHGGGFFSGAAEEYLPIPLLNHDVVVVVIQYRVGLMGFLSTEDSVIPGNFGLKDQTLALQWVQRNIHNFGGDKTKVTIMGQSAGGASVNYHILSPKSQGLFRRGIMQSGTSLSPWALTRTHGQQTKYVASVLGCPSHKGSEALLSCLRDADGKTLAALAQDFFKWSILPMTVGPRVDGDFLPEEPGLLLREGRFNRVDLLTGSTTEEGAMFVHAMATQDGLLRRLQENFTVTAPHTLECEADNDDPVGLARRVYDHYLGQRHHIQLPEHSEQLVKMFTDRLVAVDVEQVVLHHARHSGGHNTFRYLFTHRGQLSLSDFFPTDLGSHWVSHGDDLYYLFRGGPLLQPPQQPPERLRDVQSHDDLAMRDAITTLWTNFAATGNPTPDNSLGFTWEPSTEDNLQYLALKPTPTMEDDSRHQVRRFHASLPTKVNLALHPHLVQHENPPDEQEAATPGHTRSSLDEL